MYQRFCLFLLCVLLPTALLAGVCRAQERSAWEASVPSSGLNLKGKELNTVFTRYQGRLVGSDREWVWIGGNNGYLVYTNDGGNKWQEVNLNIDAPVTDIFFRDKEGYLLAGNSLFRSDDEGTRWIRAHTFSMKANTTPVLYSVTFSSPKKGCIVGVYTRKGKVIDNFIKCTTDSGETWPTRDVPGQEELLHLDFVDEQHGWAVGVGGIVLGTNDGGGTWQRLSSPTKATLFHVKFISPLRGWVVGNGAVIFYTSDGGKKWQPVNAPVRIGKKSIRLLSINFLKDGRGWIVGSNGTILYTKDDGASWELQLSGTTHDLYALSIDSQDKKHVWVIGGGGTILKYKL